MRVFPIILTAAIAATAAPAIAAEAKQADPAVAQNGNPQIDYPAFLALADQVQPIREQRLVGLTAFRHMADRPDTLLLDARSAEAFAHGHMEGAVNLPLPDFTAQSLAEVIGADPDRPILIYCNNNFLNNVAPVVRKAVSLALNIQTMINLHGYGYRNVYELGEAVDFSDSRVRWISSQAAQTRSTRQNGSP